jgi:nicotinamide-nucleotide amidase
MPAAEILTIGTEILLGEIVDTNTRFIARILRGLGVDLYRTVTIGDNLGRIAEAVREAMQRAEIVITTGGLGPTVDDPTRDAIARAVGVGTEFRPELWKQVVARLARYGRTAGENQKRQAHVPAGAIALENPVGTAPAFIVENGPNAIIALPGVPGEMETILLEQVVPYLQQRYSLDQVIQVRLLHTAGVGESLIDERIADLEQLANPSVGLAAHSGIVDVRITAKAGSPAEAAALIAQVESQIRKRLGDMIFGADGETLEDVVMEAVAGRGWTLSALESGLGGALTRRLSGPGNPALVEVRQAELQPGDLAQVIQANNSATIALGAALFSGSQGQTVELALQKPGGQNRRELSYGGHPRNAPRWAVNMALNWLRKELSK